jgi:hypothetical protein
MQNLRTHGVIQIARCSIRAGAQFRRFTDYEISRIKLMKMLANSDITPLTAHRLTTGPQHDLGDGRARHEQIGAKDEPELHSWLWVMLSAELPLNRPANRLALYVFIAVSIIDVAENPNHRNQLRETVASLGDTAVIAINMVVLLQETIQQLRERKYG